MRASILRQVKDHTLSIEKAEQMCAELAIGEAAPGSAALVLGKASRSSLKQGVWARFKAPSVASATGKSKPVEPTDYGFIVLKEIMADVERRGINEEGAWRGLWM